MFWLLLSIITEVGIIGFTAEDKITFSRSSSLILTKEGFICYYIDRLLHVDKVAAKNHLNISITCTYSTTYITIQHNSVWISTGQNSKMHFLEC